MNILEYREREDSAAEARAVARAKLDLRDRVGQPMLVRVKSGRRRSFLCTWTRAQYEDRFGG